MTWLIMSAGLHILEFSSDAPEQTVHRPARNHGASRPVASHTAHSPANYPAFLHPPIIPAASPRSRIAVFLSARLLHLASHAPSFGTVVSAPVHVRRRYRRPTPHWPALPVPGRLRVIGTVWRAALDGGGLGGRSQWTVRVLGRRFWTWAWIWWVRGVAEWWRRPWEAGS
jgi:hypothetical protein